MQFIRIEQNDRKAVERLSELASAIVKDYYDPIIGPDQNDYMIGKFQSVPGILDQFAHGYTYYIARDGDRDLGFMGYYPRGDALYLSKLYLKKEERGKGYGRQMMDFVSEAARRMGLSAVELNVNKGNPTLRVYEKMGMKRIRSEKNPIGQGFYMDDYVYRMSLETGEKEEENK